MNRHSEFTKSSIRYQVDFGTICQTITFLGVLLFFPAAESWAQDVEAVAIEEIIVTAQRREQSATDVPISLSVFTADAIAKNKIERIEDYFGKAPNVYVTEGPTHSGNVSESSSMRPAIRGISNIGGNTSSYGFYLDEFNVTRATKNPHLVDVERIELLRGPQGTFYGRNASAGVWSVINKKPNEDPYGEVNARFGNFSTWELSGVINVPVTDKFFLRAVAKATDSNGNLDNANAAGEGNGYDHQFIRLMGRFLPRDDWTVDLTFSITNEEQDDLGLVHTGIVSDFVNSICFPPANYPFTCPEDISIGFYPVNDKTYNHDFPLVVKDEYWWATGRVEYAGDRFIFTSVTGYIDSDFSRAGELDFASTDFLTEDIETIERTSFTQELRLQSNNQGPIHWVVGGLYAVDKKDEFESINFGAQNGFGLPDGLPIELLNRDEKVTTFAAFAEVTWDLSDRLTLAASGRFTRDEIDLTVNEVSFGSPSPTLSDKLSFDDFSPTVHAVFQLNEDANLYARIAKGWKSGGFELDPQDSSRDDFDEETLWNYEVGYKAYLLDRKMRLSLAAFYMDWSDVQVTEGIFFVDDMGNIVAIPDTSNAGSTSSKGLEFELFAVPNRSLELGLAIGYNEAKFDQFESASTNSGDVDLSGQPLPMAPKWSASADVQFNFPVANSWDGFVRGEWMPVYHLDVTCGRRA